ncbi:lactococcin 972 family bacteriocin [Janibacter indicus]|uniref:lactococcin 972 family bacteriocin n=1 Tax=Janibacter indicus TaxID=857417 RepID=UPI003D9A3D8D
MNRKSAASLIATLTMALGTLALPGAAVAESPRKASDPQSHHVGADVETTGSIKVIDSGETATGGYVTFTGEGTVTVDGKQSSPFAPAATVRVGGGEWRYGTTENAGGQKTCFSKYYHWYNRHSATASMDGYTDTVTQGAKGWAEAYVIRWTSNTCKVYWSNSA